MPQEDEYTEELLLLSCSPHLTGCNLEQLAQLLAMMVITIDTKHYFIQSVRIDEDEHKLYGQGHEIKTLGEYK